MGAFIHKALAAMSVLERWLLGDDCSPMAPFPKTGMTTQRQIDQLPVLRRCIEWTRDGRMIVTQVRRCPHTGLVFKTVREVIDQG
jgi:hypothetical protein